MSDTNICNFCSKPIVMMVQQGSGYCSLNCHDSAERATTTLAGLLNTLTGWSSRV